MELNWGHKVYSKEKKNLNCKKKRFETEKYSETEKENVEKV